MVAVGEHMNGLDVTSTPRARTAWPQPAPAAGVAPPPPPPPTPTAGATAATPAGPTPAAARPLDAGARREVAQGERRMLEQTWAARTAPVAAPASAPVPGPTPPSRDVSQVTPEQLRAMSRSTDPAERRLGETIARAQTAFADTIQRGGRVLASTSPGNGDRPVLTVIPPGFDPRQPARVQTHYHGWNATVADPRGHSAGTTARIQEVQAQDPQAVFVLPEANNAPARGGQYRTDWSNVTSQARTTEDALRGAGITNVGTRVVSAHSGGGNALANAIRAHRDGSGLQADRLELHDSLYGSQADLARWAATGPGRAVQQVRYFHGTNDGDADRPLGPAFGARYQRTDVRAPRPVPTLVDDHGRTVPRYSPNAHDRTVAEFLGDRR